MNLIISIRSLGFAFLVLTILSCGEEDKPKGACTKSIY
jgi:hypothetical protein